MRRLLVPLLISIGLVVFGVVPDADAQPAAPAEAVTEPADAQPISYSWKDGETTFAFGSGEAVLPNRVQLRWRDRRPAGGDGERLFNIPRGRTELTGWLGREHLTYEVRVDWTEGPGMEDLFVSWGASQNGTVNIQAGQFKVPLGRQRITSSGSQQFVDRSDVVSEFTPGRDIGVQVHGRIASDRVEYRAGVFNGAGQNTGRTTAASSTPAASWCSRLATSSIPKATSDSLRRRCSRWQRTSKSAMGATMRRAAGRWWSARTWTSGTAECRW